MPMPWTLRDGRSVSARDLTRVAATRAANAVTFLVGRNDASIACYSEQFAYGHREVILDAAGYDRSCLILGRIPHGGWTRAETIPQEKWRDPALREMPQWMWNEAWVRSARQNGARKVVAIGAPWLYLLRLRGRPTIWEPNATRCVHPPLAPRTLVLPVHSCEDNVIGFASASARLANMFDPTRTTVCLAWQDFLSRRTREQFAMHGFRLECAGYRGTGHTPGSTSGDRTVFLSNVLELIDDHDLVVSDAVTTGLIYAASIGKSVQVIRDLSSEDGHRENNCDREHGPDCAEGCLFEEHPWMEEPGSTPFDHRDELADALGWHSMRSQTDLHRMLLVRPGRVAVY